jgi:hypothetical protein
MNKNSTSFNFLWLTFDEWQDIKIDETISKITIISDSIKCFQIQLKWEEIIWFLEWIYPRFEFIQNIGNTFETAYIQI